MKTTVVPMVLLIFATTVGVAGQTQNTMPGATAECPDGSGWDATTWPVVVTDDGRHFIRLLHLYADASGESHGREALLPTEVTPAPGGDGLPFHKVPTFLSR